jgi:type II secretory pathway pseudopilin PulG
LTLDKKVSEEKDKKEAPKSRIQELQQQSVQDAIERQKQANKEKEYINQCKKQGKIARLIQKKDKPASDALTPTEIEAKIKTVTDRLAVAKKTQDTLKQKYSRSNSASQRKNVANSQLGQKRAQAPQGRRVK